MRLKYIAAALAIGLAASSQAQAVTEIQWWHSMTGANNDKVNELAAKFNASPEGIQGQRGLQGQLSGVHDRRHRGVPGRRRAEPPAGVRGRHGDDDGRQGRDRAGGESHGGRQGAVRSEGLPPGGGGLLHRQQGQHAVVPLQQLHRDVLCQQGCLQKGGARSGEGAQNLEGIRRRRGQAQGVGPGVRLHHRLAVVDAHREFQRLAQRADRHQAERHGGFRCRIHDQFAAARAPSDDAGRSGEERRIHLRRAAQQSRRRNSPAANAP